MQGSLHADLRRTEASEQSKAYLDGLESKLNKLLSGKAKQRKGGLVAEMSSLEQADVDLKLEPSEPRRPHAVPSEPTQHLPETVESEERQSIISGESDSQTHQLTAAKQITYCV